MASFNKLFNLLYVIKYATMQKKNNGQS